MGMFDIPRADLQTSGRLTFVGLFILDVYLSLNGISDTTLLLLGGSNMNGNVAILISNKFRVSRFVRTCVSSVHPYVA